MALSRVRLSFRRLASRKNARGQIADDTIKELRRFGEFADLDEEVRARHAGRRCSSRL